MATSLLKLELGAGENRNHGGFIHIDKVEYPSVDVVADVLTLEYPEKSCSLIRAVHLLEHFSPQQANTLLDKWRTWLVPNGLLELAMPAVDLIVLRYASGDLSFAAAIRDIYGLAQPPGGMTREVLDPEMIRVGKLIGTGWLTFNEWLGFMRFLYYGVEEPVDLDGLNAHRWGYSVASLDWELTHHGFARTYVGREALSLHAWGSRSLTEDGGRDRELAHVVYSLPDKCG